MDCGGVVSQNLMHQHVETPPSRNSSFASDFEGKIIHGCSKCRASLKEIADIDSPRGGIIRRTFPKPCEPGMKF